MRSGRLDRRSEVMRVVGPLRMLAFILGRVGIMETSTTKVIYTNP